MFTLDLKVWGQTLGGEISMSLESDDWKCMLGTVGMEGQADEK